MIGVSIELNGAEIAALSKILDHAVRGAGMEVAPAAVALSTKINAATAAAARAQKAAELEQAIKQRLETETQLPEEPEA